jgi:hypothetical protein
MGKLNCPSEKLGKIGPTALITGPHVANKLKMSSANLEMMPPFDVGCADVRPHARNTTAWTGSAVSFAGRSTGGTARSVPHGADN